MSQDPATRERRERMAAILEAEQEPGELVFEFDPGEMDEEEAAALAERIIEVGEEADRVANELGRSLTERE